MQRRAPGNLRDHLRRGVVRLGILFAADVTAFVVMRGMVHAVRDHAVLGTAVATAIATALPSGMLGGWQYASALLLGLLVTGNYGQGDQRRSPQRLFAACALATALPLWMTLWTRGIEPMVLQYTMTTALMWAGLVAERLAVDRAVARVRPQEQNRLDTLFVGPGSDCASALANPAFAYDTEYRPVGFVDTQVPVAPGAIGHVAEFSLLLAATGARVIVICGHLTKGEFEDIVDAALTSGCQVLSLPRSARIQDVRPTTVWRRGQALVELTAPGLKGWQLAIKRVTDIVGSVIGMALAAPLMAGIALAIKLDSPGPVLFSQDRVGMGGRPFRLLKFRTMHDGADREKVRLAHLNHSGDARLFKIRGDPRVTRFGATIRRWSLDELPQLWNVLAGDMSLVGPRPFFEADLLAYEDRHARRLAVQPGITGLWQVKGRSDVIDFEEVVRLDREYIERWSVGLDLAILASTIPAVCRRQGAY
ncbi:MAG TPA: sugar transferase [Gemmatimonadales bacterium]|nr:sugar transferase [Gemmatimonadales bacterium]